MVKKQQDPKVIALLDRQRDLYVAFEKWYTRLKRAFNRLEKIRRQLKFLSRKLGE